MNQSPRTCALKSFLLELIAYALCVFISAANVSAQTRSTTVTPEEVGVDSTALVQMLEYIRVHNLPVHSIQIVKSDRLVFDAYFYPYDEKMRHDVASVTKSITSTLIGLAIAHAYIANVQQTALALFPRRSNDDSRNITLEDLLTMRSGWDCGVDMSDPRINVDERLAAMRTTKDWLRYIQDLPMSSKPGARFAYCNVNCHLLSIILTQVTGLNEEAFARRHLFTPLGIHDAYWPSDPQGNSYGWSDLQLHPRDMATIGQLMLHQGEWHGRQVVSRDWIQVATTPHVTYTGGRDYYGYLWWIPGENLPGVFEAVGRGGQRITIWPAKQLVVVFTGGGFDTNQLSPFVLRAVQADKSLPVNEEATKELHRGLVAAKQPPPRKSIPKLPAMARQISGRTFTLASNGLGLSELTLNFGSPTMARASLKWYGRKITFPVGLDGVGRFSPNPLVRLQQNSTGEWLDGSTFLLKLDLVGAINCYFVKLHFLPDTKSMTVELTERTGLNNERFVGNR